MEKPDRFKLMRILAGFTQEGLAAAGGLSRASLTLWEKGSYNPSQTALSKLSETLDVEPAYLMFGKPPCGPAYWVPIGSERPKHLNTMIEDIKNLVPQFIRENGFDRAVVADLLDGGKAYVLGHRDQRNCLLLVEERLVGAFAQAVSVCEIQLNECTKLLTASVESFATNDLFALAEQCKEIDVAGISERIERRKAKSVSRRGGEVVQFATTLPSVSIPTPKSTTETLMRMFAQCIKGKDGKTIIVMAQFFAEKIDGLAGKNTEDFDFDEIADEARLILEQSSKTPVKSKDLKKDYPEWF